MRRLAALANVAAMVCLTAGILAQAPPNFTGKWTLVPDPAAAPAGGRGGRGGGFGGLGMEATVAQDAKTLTVTRAGQAGPIQTVYNLDGSERKNTMAAAGNSIESTSKAKWDGAKLVVVTTSNFGGNNFETTMTLSLDASGNLTVESSRPDFQGGTAPIVTKMTYKKG